MTDLLKLVDALIGDVLQGNIYTNIDSYANALKAPLRYSERKALEHPHTDSDIIPQHPVYGMHNQGSDPRLLDFNKSRPHPHPGKAGTDETRHTIYSNPPTRPLHDTQGSYTNDVIDAQRTHQGKRGEIYHPGVPPQSVFQQANNIAAGTPPPPGSPSAPRDPITSTQASPGTIDRDKIYLQSDSLIRNEGIPDSVQDLVDFHKEQGGDFSSRPSPALMDRFDRQQIRSEFHDDRGVGADGKRLGPNARGIEPANTVIAKDQGRIKDNAFSDEFGIGGKFASLTQRPVPAELRSADLIAATHWLRNVGRELSGLDLGVEPPVESQKAGLLSEQDERRIKGATFLASQFLLAGMNPSPLMQVLTGRPTNLSQTNAVWNLLAIPLAGVARVVDPAISPIVVGGFPGLGYKTDLLARVATQTDVMTRVGGEGAVPISDLPGFDAATTDASLALEISLSDDIGSADAAIPDNFVYMPFMFQDLREDPPKFLYFRAFLKEGLAETFTPDWQIDRYYGRVDQVPLYMGTVRNINLSFDVVAWSPKDLSVMWAKLQKLQSMVYPEFDTKGFLKAGPIIRMRVGDLFAGGSAKGVTGHKQGLPGYITSMDFAYDDGIWNIKKDFKVPRKVSVSLAYTVVHDGNPGIYPYEWANFIDGEENIASGDRTFGAGKFTGDSKESEINVSQAEIRRIFDTVRK